MTALHSIGLYDKLDQVFGNHNKEEGIHNKEEGITDVDGSLTLYSLIVKKCKHTWIWSNTDLPEIALFGLLHI